jgi:hypothetical protein
MAAALKKEEEQRRAEREAEAEARRKEDEARARAAAKQAEVKSHANIFAWICFALHILWAHISLLRRTMQRRKRALLRRPRNNTGWRNPSSRFSSVCCATFVLSAVASSTLKTTLKILGT